MLNNNYESVEDWFKIDDLKQINYKHIIDSVIVLDDTDDENDDENDDEST